MSKDMTIEVESITVHPGDTIGTGVGLDESGRWVTFAGDRRQMLAIAAAIEDGDAPVYAAVPTWAVL